MNLSQQREMSAPGLLAKPSIPVDCSRYALPISVICIAFFAALLLYFPPDQYSFYPQCPIHHYLRILCPGCGATRALAALLRGHITEALQLNALTTLSLPFIAAWALFTRKPLRWPQIPAAAIYMAFAVTALFTIARNL